MRSAELSGVNDSLGSRFGEFIRNPKSVAKALGALVLAGAATFATVDLLNGGNGNHLTLSQQKIAEINSNCNNLVDANSAANPNLYDYRAFLPKDTKPLTESTAASYIYSFFGPNGPLAGKVDIGSLAAVEATIAIPAGLSSLISSYNHGPDTTLNYEGYFSEVESTFNAPTGGKQSEIKACEDDFKIMASDAQFTNSFAQNGESVTIIEPIRNKKDIITGMRYEPKTVNGSLSGIEFKAGSGQTGYPEVLLDQEGVLYVKGALNLPKPKPEHQNPTTTTTEHQNPTTTTTEHQNPTTTTTESKQNNNGNGNNSGNNNKDTGKKSGGNTGNKPGPGKKHGGKKHGGHHGNHPTTTTTEPHPTTTTTEPHPTTTTTEPHPTTTTTVPYHPPTTTTTVPPTTTTTVPYHPPTTTTTVPPTTTTTLPPTTTTTGPTKPPVYCDPNIAAC